MSLLESYYTINQAIGLGITIRKDGSILLNGCQVLVSSKQLQIEKKVVNIHDVERLKTYFERPIPVALNLSGKGIIYKQVDGSAEINDGNFSMVLPHGVMEDFYVQQFVSGGFSFVAVIRKAEADKWIASLTAQGFRILMFSLGPFPVHNISPQLNVYGEDLIFNGNRIKRAEDLSWTACNYDESTAAPFPLKLENEPIADELLIPYAAAFQLVLSAKLNLIRATVPEADMALSQALSNKKLRVGGALILVACFLLLLINLFLITWLNKTNARLNGAISTTTRNTVDVQSIKDKIKEKEILLQELGWDRGIHKSVLVDQIAALLPPGIIWNQVFVNPLDLSLSRNRKSLQFQDRKIEIKGNCPQIIPVNEWIARLKTKGWIKGVQLDSYNFDQESNTGRFTLMIAY